MQRRNLSFLSVVFAGRVGLGILALGLLVLLLSMPTWVTPVAGDVMRSNANAPCTRGCDGTSDAIGATPGHMTYLPSVFKNYDSRLQRCRLPPVYYHDVALGIPRPAWYMRTQGTVRVAVLFVDFPDAPATRLPQDVFAMVNPGAAEYYKHVSAGRMDLKLEPYLTWLRLSHPSTYYAESIKTWEGHTAFMQEAVNLADPNVDFSGVELVLVLANPDATAIAYGPSAPRTEITTDEGVITRGITSGADLPSWGYLWLNHEMGHSMSLPDLYAFDASQGRLRFTGIWSLMGDIGGKGPEYFAFERWQLDWLDNSQIICQTEGERTTVLSAIEQKGGTKAVMVPLSETSALVVESRRATGYDVDIPKAGALVYRVDTSIPTGMGPIQVLPIREDDPRFEQAPLAEGESLTVCGITVENVGERADGDTVRVRIPQNGPQCEA